MLSVGSAVFFPHYGEALVEGGGYVFTCWVSSDYRYKVARITRSTGTVEVVDLGALPYNDTHFYPVLLLDPTDNRVIVITSGRYGIAGAPNDTLPRLHKTADAWGGTTFGGFVGANFPYTANGLPAYGNPVMTADGTLLLFVRSTFSGEVPNRPGYNGCMLYRFVGDGTSKSAAQLTSGSYTTLVQPTPDPDGRIYPTRAIVRDGTVHMTYSYQEATILGSTAPMRGLAYIYCDNPSATTPVWRRVDGTALTLPIASDAAAKSSLLYAHNEYGPYNGTLDIDPDGRPFLAAPRWTLSADKTIATARWLDRYRWNGTAWTSATVSTEDYGFAYGTRIFHSPSNTRSTDLADVVTEHETIRLGSPRAVDTDDGLIVAGTFGGNLIVSGLPVSGEGDYDVTLAVPVAGDYDVTLAAPLPSPLTFEDTFNRANSTTVGNGWTQTLTSATGTPPLYGIIDNKLVVDPTNATGPSRTFTVLRTPNLPYNRAVEASVSGSVWTNRLWLGRNASGQGYYAHIDRFAVAIRRADPAVVNLASVGRDDFVPGTYRLELLDGVLTLSINGEPLLSATDTTYMTAGTTTYQMGADIVGSLGDGPTMYDDFRASAVGTVPGFILTYNPNGGTNPPLVHFGGTTYTVRSASGMTRPGYNFDRWSTTPAGAGTDYAPGSTITLTAPTTLYARWTPADPVPLFEDTFNRANSATVGNGWSQEVLTANNQYGISNNQFYITQTTTTTNWIGIRRAYAGGLRNNTITIDAVQFGQLPNTSRVSVGFGGTLQLSRTDFQGYAVRFYGGGTLELRKGTGTSITNIGQITGVDRSTVRTIGLRRIGSTLQLMLDDVVVLERTDTTYGDLTHIHAALEANNGTTLADNLRIYDSALYPKLPPDPEPSTRRRRPRMTFGGL